MKKRIAKLSAFLLAFSVCSGVSALAKGDINNDGSITEKDIKSMYKYLWGTKELDAEELQSSDINGDGTTNIIDFVLQKEMYINEALTSVNAPEFSAESGFYTSDFSLSLSADADCKIYYTTDGSAPTTESTLYSGNIMIKNRSSEPNQYASITDVSHDEYVPPAVTKGTVVRAIAVDSNGNISDEVSKTYFCGIDIENQYNGFPVLCVTANPDDLFGYENGIYVRGKVFAESGSNPMMQAWQLPGNYTQRGDEWERKVFIELFEKDGKLAHSQNIGARITGNATRSYVIKSMKFYSREEYGKKNVKYELIPGATTEIDDTTIRDKYKRFTMRNGGNDLGFAQFRDNYIQSLVGDRAFETLSSRPAIMFINGEYWGVYTLQEDYSDNYIENNYNIDKDNVVIIECGREVDEGTEQDLALYQELVNFASQNDLSIDANYEKINTMMDMQSFIDYYCTEIFIANNDWMNNNNNYRIWRSRTVTDAPYEDGKWRWMLYDTEYSLSLYSAEGTGTYTEDSLKTAMTGSSFSFGGGFWGGGFSGFPGGNGNNNNNNNVAEHARLFNGLLKNAQFKQQFVTTFSDLMNKNLSRENMLTVLSEFEQLYTPVMPEQMKRTGLWEFEMESFRAEIKKIQDFINNREENIYRSFATNLSLSGSTSKLTVSVNDYNGGSVKINTITPDYSKGSFTGSYVTEYPVTLTAIAKEGYEFAGWTNSQETSPQITVDMSTASTLEAKFIKK